MTGVDKLFAALALILLAAYMGVLIWKVPSLDLIVVSVLGVLLAAFDFIRTGWRRGSRDAVPTDRTR